MTRVLPALLLAVLAAGCAAPAAPPASGGDAEPAYRGTVSSEAWARWAAQQDPGGGPSPPTTSGGSAPDAYPVVRLGEEDVFLLHVTSRVDTDHEGFRAWFELPAGFRALDPTTRAGPLPPEGVTLRVRAEAVAEGRWTALAYAQSDEEGAPFLVGDVTVEVRR